jgi:alkylation response protein AidB-like acyl-CoA dehydrogenase
MDLTLTPEYEAFRAEVRDFIAAHRGQIPDLSIRDWKAQGRLAWQQLLIKHGYAARTIPRDYGGYGAEPDILKSRIIADEFIAAGAPMGISGQGISMLVPTLLEFGTEEQRKKWIAPTLSGEIIWCQGYSEPNAGSDLASLRTSAIVDGTDFVVNGQKIWTSSAQVADMMFCLVRTELEQPKYKGISYLLIPMKSPGLEVRPLRTMTGASSFCEVFFTDVRVPIDQVVGGRGEGWSVANSTLKHERGFLGDPNDASTRLKALIDLMCREQFNGRRLIDLPVYRDRLVKLQSRVLAMQFNGLRLLTHQLKQEDPGLARMIVKLQGCEIKHQIAALGIDVMGECGILYDNSPLLRDKGAWPYNYMFELGLVIGGGTAQIQKNIISERGLGMPREPKLARVEA